jgi:hypothetical protein
MKTVKELLKDRGDDEWLYLVNFDNEQFLALTRQKDGRIDLVDYGCSNTGSDFSNCSLEELEVQIAGWLNCIETTDEEKALAWEQYEKI